MLDKHHRIIPLTFLFLAASACDRLPLSLGYGVDDVLGEDGSGSAGSAGSGSGGSGSGGAASSCLDQYDGCIITTGDSEGCLDQLSRCDGTGVAGAGGFAGAGGTSTGVGGGTSDNECFTTYQLCLESGEEPLVCLEARVSCQDAYRLPDGTFGAGGTSAGTGGFAGAGGGGTGGFAGTSADGTGTGGFAGAGGGSAGTGAGGFAGSAASSNECYSNYLLCLDSDATTQACLDALGACQTGLPFEGNAGTGAGGRSGGN